MLLETAAPTGARDTGGSKMDKQFILMYKTSTGFQQIKGTGVFGSKSEARNFVKYNGHLLEDERGNLIGEMYARIFEILPVDAAN